MNTENQKLDLSPRPVGDIITLESLLDIKTNEAEADSKTELEATEDLGLIVEDDEKGEVDLITLPDVEVENPTDSVDEESEPEAPTSTELNYRSIVDKMISSGEWESFDTIETEDGEISIDEVEMTEELFEEIVKAQKEVREENYKKQQVEGVSDFTKKLIEIEKNGGNVKDALAAYETVKEPLSQIDTSTDSGKKAVVYMQLKSQGQDEENIRLLIESYEAKGILEDKADIAERVLNEAYDEYLESLNQKAIEDKKAQERAFKNYKNELGTSVEELFEVNKTTKNKIVELATKPDSEGRYELDNLYNEIRKDPKRAAKLAMFLYNEDDYIKQVTNKVKTETNLNTFKKLSLIKKGKNSSMNINSKTSYNKKEDLIDLNKLL